MICARRTSPAPSFCERVIRASLCASSSLNARTRRVIATSPARTGTPCNAPDPEKSHPTYRIHHLEILWAGGERQAQRRVRPLANLGRRRCLHLDLGLVRSPYKSALLRSSYLWSYPVRPG